VRGRLVRLIKQVRVSRPDVIEELVRTQKITDGIKEGLDEQLARCADSAV